MRLAGALNDRRGAAQMWAALSTVYVVWGSTYLATAILTESIPTLSGVGARYLIAATVLGGFMLVARREQLRVTWAQFAVSAAQGVLLLSVCLGLLALALGHVPTGVASLLVCILPIWVVVIRLISGERPGWRTLLGVAVGFVGVGLMLIPGGGEARGGSTTSLLLWSLVIVGTSGLWALVSWASPRVPTPVNSLTATTYQMLVGGAVLVGVGMLLGERWDLSQISGRSAWALAYLAIIGSLVGWTAFTWVLRNVPVTLGSTYAYVNPVVAVALGIAFYGEAFSVDVLIGCTIVLGGVVLVVRGESVGMRSGRVRAAPSATMDAQTASERTEVR